MVTLADLGPIGLDSSSDGDVIDDFDSFSHAILGSVSSGGETSAKKRKAFNESICSLAPSAITIGTNKKPLKRKRPMKKKIKSSSTNEKAANKLTKN